MTLACSAYLWSVGVMEYWSNDERIDVFFFQHSSTPSLHYSKAETFKNFWQPLNNLFIGYNSEKIYMDWPCSALQSL